MDKRSQSLKGRDIHHELTEKEVSYTTMTAERFDAIKQSPRQASVTDVEDLCDEVERLRCEGEILLSKLEAIRRTREQERDYANVCYENECLRSALDEAQKTNQNGDTEIARLNTELAQWQANCTGRHGSQFPCGETETPRDLVAGDMLPTTLWQFTLRANRLLEDEQAKVSPDNALISFLCDAVRLAREHERMATSPMKTNER